MRKQSIGICIERCGNTKDLVDDPYQLGGFLALYFPLEAGKAMFEWCLPMDLFVARRCRRVDDRQGGLGPAESFGQVRGAVFEVFG